MSDIERTYCMVLFGFREVIDGVAVVFDFVRSKAHVFFESMALYKLVGSTAKDVVSFVQQNYLVRDLKSLRDVVQYEHDAFSFISQRSYHVEDFELTAYVEKGRRFVEKYDVGLLSKQHCDIYPLPLTAGESRYVLIRKLQSVGIEHALSDDFFVFGRRYARERQVRKSAVSHERGGGDKRYVPDLRNYGELFGGQNSVACNYSYGDVLAVP